MKRLAAALSTLALAASGMAMPSASASAQATGASDYRNTIGNNMRACAPGAGPAVRVTVDGIKQSSGNVRVQVYNGT